MLFLAFFCCYVCIRVDSASRAESLSTQLGAPLFGRGDSSSGAGSVLFLLLLPLQIVVHLLSLATLAVVDFRRTKNGIKLPAKVLHLTFLYFLVTTFVVTLMVLAYLV